MTCTCQDDAAVPSLWKNMVVPFSPISRNFHWFVVKKLSMAFRSTLPSSEDMHLSIHPASSQKMSGKGLGSKSFAKRFQPRAPRRICMYFGDPVFSSWKLVKAWSNFVKNGLLPIFAMLLG
eukprot:CAMPEP_0180555362 /NCGR_PEP_ID=MMETSP1036_2-20121128/75382_1 /TAXON_ID=632150 /ORGANISM="Azadinium spinosum, Strain 3D9" /LENGTH=120 /DNA_ID=CAMNT_0022571165 /DNA_START=366 /DNA_END=728 /DNA_ORIENTATION=+